MPKKAFLANHFNSSELKRKYLTSPDPVESRRWYILWKVSLGWTIKDSMNSTMREAIQPESPDFPVNALVLHTTSFSAHRSCKQLKSLSGIETTQKSV